MFSSNDLRNVVVGIVIFVALVLACAGGTAAYKASVPVQVDHNTMSVTDESLAQAMAKWKAQAPPVYEITVKQGSDQATLHVSDNETNLQVLSYTHAGNPVSNSNIPLYPNVQQMTVGYLFTLTQNFVSAMDQNASPPATGNKIDYFYDFEARFDPTLGYPTYIVNYQREAGATREIVWRSSPQAAIEVVDFKAAK